MSTYNSKQLRCIRDWQVTRDILGNGTKVVVPDDIDLVYKKTSDTLLIYCTETNGKNDIMKDADIRPIFYKGSFYSRGFFISAKALYDELIKQNIFDDNLNIIIYGYSLGGAIAQDLGDIIEDNGGQRPEVIGFGVPNTIMPLFNWKRIKSRKTDIIYEQGFGLISNIPPGYLSFGTTIRLPKYKRGRWVKDNHNFYWMTKVDLIRLVDAIKDMP